MKSLVKIRLGTLIFLVLFFSFGVLTAAHAYAGEFDVYGIIEQFTWKEFNDNNTQLLKESGPRYGVGFTYYHEFRNHITVKPRVEIVGGTVDYDGATQAGVPVKSHTRYFGGKLEADIGWRLGSSQQAAIEPFGGIGFRGWSRDIQDAIAQNGTPAYGYTEDWYTFYLRAGLRGDVALGEKTRLFAEAGGKLPVYNENTARFSDAGLGPDVRLKPGNEPSLFAEAGIKYKSFKAGMYYDSMRFSKSDVAYSGSVGYYQPKSQADMYGIRVGASF